MTSYRVGILGATGLVGQRFVALLQDHPWFEPTALAASDRSAGKIYGDAVRWRLSSAPPRKAAAMVVRSCRPSELEDCDLVLSALDASVAKEVEPRFVEAGFAVVSNSSAHRMLPDVPILVPEVNAAHASLVETQRKRSGPGYLVTNPNCAVTGLVVALAPLHRAFGVRRLVVATMQSISGAGLEGPRGLDIVGNVIPWIPGEEEKIEGEVAKILGSMEAEIVRPAPVVVSAHCHRVPTSDGHLEAVSVELERDAAPEEATRVLRGFAGDVADLGLPSAPRPPLIVRDEPDRPQTRLDREAGSGMSVVVGRIRRCPVFTLRLELLSHNTIRGAAGGALLNAELLKVRGMLPRRAAE